MWGRINTAIIGCITILAAISLNYVKEIFNLLDIMIKSFGALGPAIMLPLLGGLFIKKINARGAISGVLMGTLSGVGLVVLNAWLLGEYKESLADNATLSYWLKQGYNSLSIGVNILVTLISMWLGSNFGKTSEAEKDRVKEFFKKMDFPTEPKIERTEYVRSPFSLVGIALMLLGIVILFVGLIMLLALDDSKAFVLDTLTSGVLIIIGLILWVKTRTKVSVS